MRMLGLLLVASTATFALGQYHESNGARLMYNDFTLEAREQRIAEAALFETNDAVFGGLMEAEKQKILDEYTERGSKYGPDGETIIEGNELKATSTQPHDPRVPPGFADPFWKKVHEAENIELSVSQFVLDGLTETAAETWSSGFILLNSKGHIQQTPLERRDEFNTLYAASPNKIIRRVCESCLPSHKEIFYKRITALPNNFLNLLENNWVSASNTIGVDFNLYSSYEDALSGTNAWPDFCTYDQVGVGFPGECGPTSQTPDQWNNFNDFTGQPDVAFFVEDANAEAADFYLSEVDKQIDYELANDPALAYKRGVCAYNPFRDRRRICFKACRQITSLSALQLCINMKDESLRFKMHAWGADQEQEEGTEADLKIKTTHALGGDVSISRGTY